MNKSLRAALVGCTSAVVLGFATTPSYAEQQVFSFFVNTGAGTGTGNHYKGPACDRTTVGVNHTANDCITFQTTSSQAGAMSEASSIGIGTQGHAVGSTLNDAFDGYGGLNGGTLGQSGSPNAPIEPPGNLSYGGLTVVRDTEVTHGPGGMADTTVISAEFIAAGVPNAARLMATFTNNTVATIDTIVSFNSNLGSDSNTRIANVGGNNTFVTSYQLQSGMDSSDPVVTGVFGNNAYTATQAHIYAVDGDDNPDYAYHLVVAPGQTVSVVTFVILTGDILRGTGVDANSDGIDDYIASDIALGANYANLILANPGLFLADLTALQRSQIINFNLCTTIDNSQPSFNEMNCAVTANPMVFDGGTLKPTTTVSFSQPVTVNALGGKVDTTNGNVTFTGVISGAGGLTFQGTHTTILTNTETLTGASTVSSGTLQVDGSLATSALTVNGGTVTGTGTLGTTTVNAGGAISPAGTGIGTLTVSGNLTTAAGSTYRANVASATHDLLAVTGSATINGGTVAATAGAGTFTIGQNIAIVTATGARTGTFTTLSASGFNATMMPTLTYDAHNVYLTLAPNTLTPALAADASVNERSVAAGIDYAVAHDNAQAFGPLYTQSGNQLEASLDQLSGEANAAAEQSAFASGSSFTNLLLNPYVDARGGMAGASGPALAFAPLPVSGLHVSLSSARGARNLQPGDDLLANLDAPNRASISASAAGGHMGVWLAGYGERDMMDGVSGIGSHTTAMSETGFAGGMDLRLGETSVIGAAVGYGHSSWTVPSVMGGGKSNVTQGGVYGSTRWNNVFVSAAFNYSDYNVTTNRTLILGGTNTYQAKYNANGYGGRVELGDRLWHDYGASIAPYVAVNVQTYDAPAYSETTLSGSAAFAETVAAKSTTNVTSDLGLKIDWLGGRENMTTLHATLAWVHAYSPNAQSTVSFSSFLGSSFVVKGAPQASDAALVGIGLDTSLTAGLNLGLAVNSTVSGETNSIGGSAALSYRW